MFAAADRRFGPDDLAVAEEIGRRAAVAIANCRLYREARLAVAARNEFMAVAAHELRTPVTVLQLKLQQVAVKQQASVCGTCEHAVPADYAGAARQISRLGHLIEGLLDVSRIVGGRVNLEREELDLCDVAGDAIERLGELATRNRSKVVLRCPEAGPRDMGPARLLVPDQRRELAADVSAEVQLHEPPEVRDALEVDRVPPDPDPRTLAVRHGAVHADRRLAAVEPERERAGVAALGVEPLAHLDERPLQRDVDEPRGREPRRDMELDAGIERYAREPPPLG